MDFSNGSATGDFTGTTSGSTSGYVSGNTGAGSYGGVTATGTTYTWPNVTTTGYNYFPTTWYQYPYNSEARIATLEGEVKVLREMLAAILSGREAK
jgi:hypothetical protein